MSPRERLTSERGLHPVLTLALVREVEIEDPTALQCPDSNDWLGPIGIGNVAYLSALKRFDPQETERWEWLFREPEALATVLLNLTARCGRTPDDLVLISNVIARLAKRVPTDHESERLTKVLDYACSIISQGSQL